MRSKSLAENSVDTIVLMVAFIGIRMIKTAMADSIAVGTGPIFIPVKDKVACRTKDNP